MSNAGQRLVKLLDEGLLNGIIWKASERATLGLISDTADMVETLKGLLAAEVASLDRSTHRCAELAGEIRQAQASIAKMIASLDPEMTVQAKSARHQSAALHAMEWGWSRWASVAATRPPRRGYGITSSRCIATCGKGS